MILLSAKLLVQSWAFLFQYSWYVLFQLIHTFSHASNDHGVVLTWWYLGLLFLISYLNCWYFCNFPLTFALMMFWSLGHVKSVYTLNQLNGPYTWSPHLVSCCYYFLSHPMFRVPAQSHLVIYCNRFLLPFQLAPVMVFFLQSLLHSPCCHQNLQIIAVPLQVLIASKHLTSRSQVHYSYALPAWPTLVRINFMPLFFLHALLSTICSCILIIAFNFLGSTLHLGHSCPLLSRFLYKYI